MVYICALDSSQKIAQFSIRMFVLSLALISSLFVGLTCLKSKKGRYWVFKLLIVQSFSESIDLIGAIALSYQSECYEILCDYVGYIMHSCWLTSFSCLLLLFYLYFKALELKSNYLLISRNINLLIGISIIWPYLWLFFPFITNNIGPTGWGLYSKNEKFYLFCGFEVNVNVMKENETIFLIFWSIPQWIIFGIVLYLRSKINQRIKLFTTETHVEGMEFEIIQKTAKFSIIYIIFWLTNQGVKYFTLFYQHYEQQLFVYIIVVITYLLFELHLVIIAFLFYKNYKYKQLISSPIINIKQIWFPKQRKKRLLN